MSTVIVMDDNKFNGFDSGKPRKPSGFDPYYPQQKNVRNDFKVSINDQSDIIRSKSVAPNTARAASSNNDDKFKVSLPQNGARQPAASSQAKRSTAQRSASSSSAAPKKSGARSKSAASSKRVMTPAQAAKAKAKRKYSFMRGSMILCTCLIIIAIITTAASSLALSTINDILAINKDSGTTVSVIIDENADFDDVIDTLADNGLISQKFLVKLFCKFRHYDKYKNKNGEYVNVTYEPGVYYLDMNSGVEAMLETIKSSSSVSKDTVRLTFPEGWTIAQIFQKIEKYGVCTAEKLYANLDIVGKQFDFYEDIKSNSGRYLKAEGYLFPDTYDFYLDENASSVLKKLFSNFQEKWKNSYKKEAKNLGLSCDEVIILASIIQREAKNKSQMADVSSVLHNRLADPSTYPQLQMNSTQDYINSLKEFKVFTDYYYSVYLDSYNTYSDSVEGLPPGAICNPGIDAIEAALHPSDTDYHFFCHDKKGNIYLAVTASEHKANTEKVFYESN